MEFLRTTGAHFFFLWASPMDTFQRECVDFLLLIVTPIVSLFLVIERFRESYGDLRRKK
jgi:hypothetical protein